MPALKEESGPDWITDAGSAFHICTVAGKKEYLLERLKDGNIHMCFFSCSGYRPFMHPPPSLGNLLLDITLYVQFHSGVLFFVNFRVRVRVRVSYRVRV